MKQDSDIARLTRYNRESFLAIHSKAHVKRALGVVAAWPDTFAAASNGDPAAFAALFEGQTGALGYAPPHDVFKGAVDTLARTADDMRAAINHNRFRVAQEADEAATQAKWRADEAARKKYLAANPPEA